MQRFIVIIVLIAGGINFLFGGTGRELTVEDIFASGKFRGQYLNSPRWLPDSKAFAFLKRDEGAQYTSIYKHGVESGEESKWIDGTDVVDPANGDTLRFTDYRITPSGTKIIFKTNARRIWRRFDDARYFVFDIAAKTMTPVREGDDLIRHAKLSPDETMVGYVFENNIYIKNLNTGKVTQVTGDGSETILNGLADWVYEEEFGQADRWTWSPDGKKIAFCRSDQKDVPVFSWVEYDGLYGKVQSVHYPKAGQKNSVVTVGVYHLDSGNTVWMDTGKEVDQYIPRIQWAPNGDELLIERMNRLQNKLELLGANADNGKSRVILTETDSCWVDVVDELIFLDDDKTFIWPSERDGYRHIYLYNLEGTLLQQVTHGKWVVRTIYGVDEETGRLYFSANKDTPLEWHLFWADLRSKKIKRISVEPGMHSANFAPDFSVFIHNYSNIVTPTQTVLARASGHTIRRLVKNDIPALKEYDLAYPEFITFTTSDGVELHAKITKPVDFDPNKKYPVLIYGYSGPASQLVRNSWGRASSMLWYTLLTQKGYIIFTVDQRGTGGRGKAFKNLAYGDIGKYMLKDHIEAVKYLRSLPFVDADRIGIWGWSGGGYLTLMAMTKGSDYFKAGIAVAPVSDFRLYDSIWSERYMGLPQDNTAGYDSTSALSYTDKYKGGLLVVHGLSDDNVHAQNTMQFIQKLQAQAKPFRIMVYPGKNHSMIGGPGVYLHLYKMMTDFIVKNL